MKTFLQKYELPAYFLLSYAIIYGVLFGYIWLRPGEPLQPWSLVWFLAAFSPTISATLISWITGGWEKVKGLFSGFTRWKVGWFWWAAAAFMFFGPLLIAAVYGLLGNPVVGLQPGVTIPSLLGTILFIVFSGPASEEAGWRGFALPRLQQRYSALVSSLILGVIWTFWHLPFFYLTGATQVSIPMPIYLLLVTTLTVYITWLYNNARGSLIITWLAHFSFNLTGTLITGPVTLMPAMTFYLTSGPLLFLITAGVVVLYGPKTLTGRGKGDAAKRGAPARKIPA